jgi:hypothetical protein
MALVRANQHIQAIRGRFGGVYFKTQKGQIHCQAMPRAIAGIGFNLISEGINRWTMAAGMWSTVLLLMLAEVWAEFARTYLVEGVDGVAHEITGYMWYMKYAMMYPETVHEPFWQPPHNPGDLPYFVITYQGRWLYDHTPDQWPDDCCAGYYWKFTTYNGQWAYETDDHMWDLWWNGTDWVISPALGIVIPGKTFYSMDHKLQDYYKNPDTHKTAHCYFGGHVEE